MNTDSRSSKKDFIKDISSVPAPYQNFGSLSYTKTHKLVAALYMVTDIMDNEEPIKNKLRTFGVEILSDTISMTRLNIGKNIQSILSFLDIAFTMSMISEMNKNILANEFIQLKNSLIVPQDNPMWLEEFLREEKTGEKKILSHNGHLKHSKGHLPAQISTRLGVQKGSTLLKALSKIEEMKTMSDRNNFNTIREQRRNNIINIIRNNGGSSTIKDIREKINTEARGPLSCSEKTLQRELMSMTKDSVLNKTGEKRWSRYNLLAS